MLSIVIIFRFKYLVLINFFKLTRQINFDIFIYKQGGGNPKKYSLDNYFPDKASPLVRRGAESGGSYH